MRLLSQKTGTGSDLAEQNQMAQKRLLELFTKLVKKVQTSKMDKETQNYKISILSRWLGIKSKSLRQVFLDEGKISFDAN